MKSKKNVKYVYLLKGKELSKDGSLFNIVPIVTTSDNVVRYFVKNTHSVQVTTLPVINKAPKPKVNKK